MGSRVYSVYLEGHGDLVSGLMMGIIGVSIWLIWVIPSWNPGYGYWTSKPTRNAPQGSYRGCPCYK